MIEIVRRMTKEDIGGVLEVERESFPTPWSERLFYDELRNNHTEYYVYEIDGEIAAYAGVWFVIDEGQITNIAVKEKYRRMGIGEMLLKKLIKVSKENEITIMMLEVRESNTAARTLYNKLGFQESGLRKRYYHNPTENAVLMNLDLQKGDKLDG